MPTEAVHFLNGKLVGEKELLVSVRDLGFMRGYGVFDFLITYGRKPFMLSRHIERLYNSTAEVGITIPHDKEEIESFVLQTLSENRGGEKAIKVLVSGGSAPSLLPTGSPTIVITIDPHAPLPAELYEKGAGIITAKHTRYLPYAKTTNYLEGVKQMQEAAKVGAIEPVYYSDTQVFEGCTSNIFALIGGKLLSPTTDVLAGITRGVILEHVHLDIPIELADFSREELLSAQEVFLSASNKEVLPITKIDGKKVGKGAVGPVTREVMEQFRAFTRSDTWD